MDTLWITCLNRPYVMAFLITYLIISSKLWGWRWSVLFLLCGYTIAFLSEYLSINYGVPYGWYFYKYENLKGEWLNHGVPVWDSASYVFMCFAGLEMAKVRRSPVSGRLSLMTLFKAATLTTLLDVVIDPVAHLGKSWFLGDIYYYPTPGFYFDVTLANFEGWFVVSFVICGVGLSLSPVADRQSPRNNLQYLLWRHAPIGLYYGIMGFGIVIALYLQKWMIVACDVFWVLVTVQIAFGKPAFRKG